MHETSASSAVIVSAGAAYSVLLICREFGGAWPRVVVHRRCRNWRYRFDGLQDFRHASADRVFASRAMV